MRSSRKPCARRRIVCYQTNPLVATDHTGDTDHPSDTVLHRLSQSDGVLPIVSREPNLFFLSVYSVRSVAPPDRCLSVLSVALGRGSIAA